MSDSTHIASDSSAEGSNHSGSPTFSQGSKTSKGSGSTANSSPDTSPSRCSKAKKQEPAAKVDTSRPDLLEHISVSLSAGAQLAFNQYKDLYLDISGIPTYLVQLTADEYGELQEALIRVPPLNNFVRLHVRSKWTSPDRFNFWGSLIISMETVVHSEVSRGICEDIRGMLDRYINCSEEDTDLGKNLRCIEQVSTLSLIETVTMRSEPGGRRTPVAFKAIPDASFAYNDGTRNYRQHPLVVIEVGFSQSAANLHSKAMDYARIPRDLHPVNTIVTIKLPYKKSAAQTLDGPFQEEGVCTVYRPLLDNKKWKVDIVETVFMGKNGHCKGDRYLDLSLADFCPSGTLKSGEDSPIRIHSMRLTEIFQDAAGCQEDWEDEQNMLRRYVEDFDRIPGASSTESSFIEEGSSTEDSATSEAPLIEHSDKTSSGSSEASLAEDADEAPGVTEEQEAS
ncbi:hypothetical protein OPT61_g4738 [Boeremia exigua]|uniref:Uncharacterized protein n=1 Tax=Boeremia exigua TaxID=749465 RepID=A0ACC2ID55_9PLEO|nr:hypothetical protein OPT61_g4738 [Boeremia exigua]